MDSSEWTLVFFTVLSQLAAGIYMIQSLLMKPEKDNLLIYKSIFIITVPLLVLSMFLSFFHLGNPFRALNALNNLQSSWLSREVLFISLLTIINILQLLLIHRDNISFTIIRILNYVGLISAFLFIFSMAKIYMLDAAPVWNSIYTPVEFFSCSLILGGVLLLMVLLTRRTDQVSAREMHTKANILFILLLLFLFVDLANTFYHHYIDFSEPLLNAAEISYFPAIARVILLIISISLLIFRFYIFRKKHLTSGFSAIAVIFFILLIAELTGRYFFYASYVKIGV